MSIELINKRQKKYKVELSKRITYNHWDDWQDITPWFIERQGDIECSIDDDTLEGTIQYQSVTLKFDNLTGKFNRPGSRSSLWAANYIYSSGVFYYKDATTFYYEDASYTVNELVGKYIVCISNKFKGDYYLISANTTTTISISGVISNEFLLSSYIISDSLGNIFIKSRIRLYEYFDNEDIELKAPLIEGLILNAPEYTPFENTAKILVGSYLNILSEVYLFEGVLSTVGGISNKSIFNLVVDTFSSTFSELGVTSLGASYYYNTLNDNLFSKGDNLLKLFTSSITNSGSIGGINRYNQIYVSFFEGKKSPSGELPIAPGVLMHYDFSTNTGLGQFATSFLDVVSNTSLICAPYSDFNKSDSIDVVNSLTTRTNPFTGNYECAMAACNAYTPVLGTLQDNSYTINMDISMDNFFAFGETTVLAPYKATSTPGDIIFAEEDESILYPLVCFSGNDLRTTINFYLDSVVTGLFISKDYELYFIGGVYSNTHYSEVGRWGRKSLFPVTKLFLGKLEMAGASSFITFTADVATSALYCAINGVVTSITPLDGSLIWQSVVGANFLSMYIGGANTTYNQYTWNTNYWQDLKYNRFGSCKYYTSALQILTTVPTIFADYAKLTYNSYYGVTKASTSNIIEVDNFNLNNLISFNDYKTGEEYIKNLITIDDYDEDVYVNYVWWQTDASMYPRLSIWLDDTLYAPTTFITTAGTFLMSFQFNYFNTEPTLKEEGFLFTMEDYYSDGRLFIKIQYSGTKKVRGQLNYGLTTSTYFGSQPGPAIAAVPPYTARVKVVYACDILRTSSYCTPSTVPTNVIGESLLFHLVKVSNNLVLAKDDYSIYLNGVKDKKLSNKKETLDPKYVSLKLNNYLEKFKTARARCNIEITFDTQGVDILSIIRLKLALSNSRQFIDQLVTTGYIEDFTEQDNYYYKDFYVHAYSHSEDGVTTQLKLIEKLPVDRLDYSSTSSCNLNFASYNLPEDYALTTFKDVDKKITFSTSLFLFSTLDGLKSLKDGYAVQDSYLLNTDCQKVSSIFIVCSFSELTQSVIFNERSYKPIGMGPHIGEGIKIYVENGVIKVNQTGIESGTGTEFLSTLTGKTVEKNEKCLITYLQFNLKHYLYINGYYYDSAVMDVAGAGCLEGGNTYIGNDSYGNTFEGNLYELISFKHDTDQTPPFEEVLKLNSELIDLYDL